MSKILNLAQSFEEQSKQQADNIEQTLKHAFEKHEQSICEALKSSERKINADIHAQQSKMSRAILKTWVWLPITLAAVLLLSWGVAWIQGEMIAKNWKTISQQKAKIDELEEMGGKIQITHCGDNRRLCVLIDKKAATYNGEKGEYRVLKGY